MMWANGCVVKGLSLQTQESPVRFPRPPTFWLIAQDKLLTLGGPSSPRNVNWYQLASGLGWDTVSINAMQSHSGVHLVAKRLYAILKYAQEKIKQR